MAKIQSNGLTLEYESLGDENAPVILLIMGLGMQMIAWPDPFCNLLVARGYRVVRFDNREVGFSQKLDHLGKPRVGRAILRALAGLSVRAPYALEDMVRDTAGLLDALEIEKAHVVGASMGGMIAQLFACHFPERAISLTSLMSTTGSRKAGRPSTRMLRLLMRQPEDPKDVNSVVEHFERLFRVIGSPAYPTPQEDLRALLRATVERGYHPEGVLRQMNASLASGDLSPVLGMVRCPTLVIHGKSDPLIPYTAGIDTAVKIRDARLVLLDGYGHDFPPQLNERLADLIASHVVAAEGQ